MLSREDFNNILTAACGEDKAARLKFIDEYDKVRTTQGIHFAEEHLQNRVKITWASKVLHDAKTALKDEDATKKIDKILASKDESKIIRVATLLDDKKIQKAIRAQGVTEETIRNVARGSNKELQTRKFLRKEMKQATAILNMTLGLIGHDGYHHATPHQINMRNGQKARWMKFGKTIELNNGERTVSMFDMMKSAS